MTTQQRSDLREALVLAGFRRMDQTNSPIGTAYAELWMTKGRDNKIVLDWGNFFRCHPFGGVERSPER